MDTSEIYIKMCKSSLLNQIEFNEGDLIFVEFTPIKNILSTYNINKYRNNDVLKSMKDGYEVLGFNEETQVYTIQRTMLTDSEFIIYGDYRIKERDGKFIVGLTYEDGITDEREIDSVTILYRQDQLQETIESYSSTIPSYLIDFCEWINNDNKSTLFHRFEYRSKLKSMEQIWLAFVMKYKFNKVWSFESEIWVEDE